VTQTREPERYLRWDDPELVAGVSRRREYHR
jgi:hypothetical protein